MAFVQMQKSEGHAVAGLDPGQHHFIGEVTRGTSRPGVSEFLDFA
jgi:hypothetical protein